MKNIFITGSTDGIGKLAATRLAGEGHTIYIHGRNQEKVDATISEVKSKTNKHNIFGFVADLSDLDAVIRMAQEIKEAVGHIDVLINNAGVFKSSVSQNSDGFDLRFVVNYLAPYLLTNELLPLLREGTVARIINLSSAAQSDISYNAMLGKEPINVNASYAQSKLAITMWSVYLADQFKDIVVIAVNPGSLLNTKMAKEAYGQYWSPAEKGSDVLFDLVLSDEHKANSGKYFDNDSGTFANAHPHAYDRSAISELINFTNNLIN